MQLIRTIKYWSKIKVGSFLSSYLLEVFILNYFDSRVSVSKYVDLNLRDFWQHIITSIYYSVDDPKGFDGNINNLTFAEKKAVSDAAQSAYTISCDAISLETSKQDVAASIKKWGELFGKEFPTYG